MSNLVLKNLKNKLKEMHHKHFAIKIGLYDSDNKVAEEKTVPLGNYIFESFPSKNEKEIIENLCARGLK
tara:strand:+ start:293 stop:499 length:207 start_codon:yes stop_codon:yes gene_type:complete